MHTPFDGSSPPFHIGVSRIAADEWIEVDEHLPAYLAEKRRLAALVPQHVFVEEAGTREAQRELLELLIAHLPARYPALYRRHDQRLEILPAGENVSLEESDAPLRLAARLVQEDLILMRRGEEGWRLAAGSLSFPSSWHLREKFAKPIPQIHAAVPGFGVASKNAGIIERMFDNLEPGQVYLRWNWGFYDDNALYHPAPGNGTHQFAGGAEAGQIFLRMERQTLRKLPHTRDVVFTIRTHLKPLSALKSHPGCQQLAGAIAQQIESLSPAQLAYKGLAQERERLLERLRELSS